MMKRDYYKLDRASNIINCAPDDLIHHGAKGQLDIHILLGNWEVKVIERVHGKHTEWLDWSKPLTKRLHPKCLAHFEANPTTAEPILCPQTVYTYQYQHPLAQIGEFWEFDALSGFWRYRIGDIIFLLRRQGFIYPTTEYIQALMKEGESVLNIEAWMPPPIKLSECEMVVLADDLDRLRLNSNQTTDQAPLKVIAPHSNNPAGSILLAAIDRLQRRDFWADTIRAAVRDYFSEHGSDPSPDLLWHKLHTIPPDGYFINLNPGDKNHEQQLEIVGEKPLCRAAFNKRLKKYTSPHK